MLKNDDFPTFLYRAFTEEQHAVDFVESGTLRLGNILYYRNIEDLSRRDKRETESSYFQMSQGVKCHISGTFLTFNRPIYLLCTSGPDVEFDRLRQEKDRFIVRINDPAKLLEDLTNGISRESYFSVTNINFRHVSYSRDEFHDCDPWSHQSIELNLIQKSLEEYYYDEYRYLISVRIPFGRNPKEFLFCKLGKGLIILNL